MGSKPSNIFQMDRPESGGADHDDERENSGLLDRAKQEFAERDKAKRVASAAETANEKRADGPRSVKTKRRKPNP